MAEANEKCCLCFTSVSEGTFFTKRRKIMGSASSNALKVLDELTMKEFRKKFSCTVKNDGLICHKCKKNAEELPVLIRKAENSRKNLLELIGRVVGCEVETIRKRNVQELLLDEEEAESPPVPPKVPNIPMLRLYVIKMKSQVFL
jgi:hypothetical protein